MKKLKLMLVLLACFVGSFAWQSVHAAKHTAYVIYADAGWTPNCVHVWESESQTTEWPGTPITLTDSGKKIGGKTVYKFEFDVTFTPKGIIFGKTDETKATDDGEYTVDNAVYTISGELNSNNSYRNKISVETNPVFDGDGDDPTPKTYKAYIVNNSGWSSGVRAHIWEKDTDGFKTNWPGVKLTLTDTGKKYDNQQVYSFEVDLTFNPKSILFNDPDNENSKTPDQTFGEGYLYVLSGTTCTAYDKDSWSFDSTPTYPTKLTFKGWQGSPQFKTYTTADRDAEGKYAFSLNLTTNYNWFFETSDARYVPVGSSNLDISEGGTFKTQKKPGLSYEAHQFSLTRGKYNGTAWFEEDGTISFTIAKEVVEETWPDLYIIGKFTEEWKFRDRFKASSTDGKYTWTFSAFPYVNQEWKIAADDYKIEYSAGDLMPQGNAPIRTIEFNKSYTCKIKRKGDAAGLGNMVLATSSDVTTTVTLDITTTPPTLSVATEGEIVRPEEYLTLYMSFGQDRITNGNRDEAPRIRFFTTKQTTGVDVPNLSDCTDAPMEKVFPEETNSPLWKYTITRDQLSSVKDVMFYFYTEATKTNKNSNDHQQYIAGLATETRGSGADAFISDWDATNWTKYIYFADGDGRAAQSYMTFDDFLAEKNKTKRHLYIVGGGFAGLKGWQPMPENGNIDGEPTTLHVVAAGEAGNVFYQDVEVDSENLQTSEIKNEAGVLTETNKGAKFKMSWVRPLDWYKANYPAGTTMDRQRSWATFNLGIVGYAQSHPAVTSSKLPIITTTNGSNTEVYCTPGFIIPNNNYNQSDWFIREKYLSGNTTYTLVVDLDDKCQTACLLPCSPNPTVVADGISVETVAMEISDALNIWDNSSDRLSAETTNGKAVITDFNVVTATATVVAANHETIEGLKNPLDDTKSLNFKIAYEIYSGEDAVGTYEGKPARIRIEGVGLGSEADLGVRAIYRSGDTELTFHSRRASSPITVGDGTTLPAPAIKGKITEKTFTGGTNMLDDEDSPRYTLGAYALVPVTAPAMTSGRDYKWYADFELTTNGHHIDHPQHANGGEVVGTDHPATKLNAVTISSVAYTPWAEGSEYTADNNWSAKLAATDAWPLHLPEVVEVKRTYKDESKKQFEETTPEATVNVNVYAVYPFLTDPQAKPQVVSSETPAAAPARKITINPDHNYVVKLAKSNAATATFSLGSGDLTAVRDIIAPQAPEAEAEYYNLQGVRVRGELTPGIYVRRCGSVAEKVVVR